MALAAACSGRGRFRRALTESRRSGCVGWVLRGGAGHAGLWRHGLPQGGVQDAAASASIGRAYAVVNSTSKVARYDSKNIGQETRLRCEGISESLFLQFGFEAKDMLSLLGALGKDCYALVGHDWGALHVWYPGTMSSQETACTETKLPQPVSL